MDTKLCRICGNLSENYVQIFRTEGLKNKIETCLPIIVSPHCLLPDTICTECLENVSSFYSFIKHCLQNIIVLEANYDITESCLKTKRKHDKGCYVDFTTVTQCDSNIQTDEDFGELFAQHELVKRSVLVDTADFHRVQTALRNMEGILLGSTDPGRRPRRLSTSLVPYDLITDAESECDDNDCIVRRTASNDLIEEIAHRGSVKRAATEILYNKPKIFKMDNSRRKGRMPKRIEQTIEKLSAPNLSFSNLEDMYREQREKQEDVQNYLQMQDESRKYVESNERPLPQVCLLCDVRLSGPATLSAHIFEEHGIDMTQVVTNEPVLERKKKIPNLLKITDLKPRQDSQDCSGAKDNSFEEPPTLQPTFVCSICPAVHTSRNDLFNHLRSKHPKSAALMCGLCLHTAPSYGELTAHVATCRQQHSINSRYYCKVCCYQDDGAKSIENHIAVHDFVLDHCRKQLSLFDPSDYVDINESAEGGPPTFTCNDCSDEGSFNAFKDFSAHRRSRHQIFHCDLCNKFYGRNSHLWKHVNRLHKGHPSITCLLCQKTSASKYHLLQHFNKIHGTKATTLFKTKTSTPNSAPAENVEDDFMKQKFRGFDFQSVRQSFMRQEMLAREEQKLQSGCQSDEVSEIDEGDVCDNDEAQGDQTFKVVTKLEQDYDSILQQQHQQDHDASASLPKEIDSSSNLYTNIITNYTPPTNEGSYKCPKCYKAFHKRILLKKHKKNCRPRLQRDLLTRCKTCSRIFKDRQSLAKHLINYHSEYACEICGQKVQSKCEIISHIRFMHPSCHLVCKMCDNILRSQMDLKEHMADHRNSFVCQFCGDVLPTKIKLKMHILSLHRKILSLSCGICLKLFETQYILRDHVRLVHKDELSPLTSCPVCGKNYGSKWKTFDHINKSHGRIFYPCKVCLEIFESPQLLQTHVDTNHGSNGLNTAAPSRSINYETPGFSQADAIENNKDSSSELEEEDEDDEMSVGKTEVMLSEPEEPENKISLLEKRLLGIKPKAGPTNPVLNNLPMLQQKLAPLQKDNNASYGGSKESIKKSSKQTIQEPLLSVVKREPDADLDPNCNNPSQNSSKRTVYVNSNDPSLCEICLKTWPAKKHLWQHYIRCHKSAAATVCGICLKTNKDYKTLQVHLVQTHPNLLHGQGFGSNFICRICGRYHNARSKLKLHMAIHENFDWSLLNEQDHHQRHVSSKSSNGYMKEEFNERVVDSLKSEPMDGNFNYESLIEQVECSSNSEYDLDANVKDDEYTSSSDGEDDDDTSGGDSRPPPTLTPSRSQQKPHETDGVVAVSKAPSRIYTTSDESSDSNQSISDASETYGGEDVPNRAKSSSDDEDDDDDDDDDVDVEDDTSSQFSNGDSSRDRHNRGGGSGGQQRSDISPDCDQLDYAIRSISYDDGVGADGGQARTDDMCDLQQQQQHHSLNPSELQSAVDSIL